MAPQPRTHRTTSRVAVVDDEPAVSDVIRRALRDHHSVHVFESAEQIFESLEEGNRYDAILCDLFMPGKSGRDIYDTVKDRWPEQAANIVFMSGASLQRSHDELLEGLDRPMIRKPFRLHELRSAVRERVERR